MPPPPLQQAFQQFIETQAARDAARELREIEREARDAARDQRDAARDQRDIARDQRDAARDSLLKDILETLKKMQRERVL